VLVANLGRRLAERLLAFFFGFMNAMTLVLGQRGHGVIRADGLALERDGHALGRILYKRRDNHSRAFKTQAFAVGHHAVNDAAVE
jgi:hypothetical protein